MLKTKRVIIATLCGVLFGFVCMFLASSNPDPSSPVTDMIKWSIVISRTMLGFMIGISALKLRWWLHGIVLGAVASIPMVVPMLFPWPGRTMIAVSSLVMGIIYGFLTELITSVLFKAKSPAWK